MSTVVQNKQNTIEAPTKIWNKVFVSIFITNMALNLGQQMVQTLIAKYADFLGATATIVGLVSSIFALTALLFKVVSGPAIDTFNRKYILMGAMLIMATAFWGYSISNTIPMLFAFRLLQGTGQAFTATCCLALAADALPADQFGAGIGYFSLAQAACQAIGPTVGIAIIGAFGYQVTFGISAVLVLCAVFVAASIKVNYTQTKKFKLSLSNVIAIEAIIPTVLLLCLSMAFQIVNSFLLVYADKQGVKSNIGLFFTVYAVTLLFTRPMIGKLADKLGLVKVLIPAMLCFTLSFIIISFSSTLIMFLLAAFVSAFGFGTCQPAIQALAMKCVSKEKRGAGSSMCYIGNDLGNLIGPIAAGAIAEKFGYAVMWRSMVIPIIVAIFIVIICSRRINHVEENFRTVA